MSDTHSMLIRLLVATVKYEASDLHLKVGMKPMVRVHGVLNPLNTREIDAETMQALFGEALACTSSPSEFRVAYDEEGQVDFSFTLPVDDDENRTFRVNVAKERSGHCLVARLIAKEAMSIDEIGLRKELVRCAERPEGLILVTGATGSGKSMTQASLIEHLKNTFAKKIITIESPIEFFFDNDGKSMVMQREIPNHTRSSVKALEAALREDPDIIMFGEIRDEATLLAALGAAETGHVVFATLHTKSAAGTLERILGMVSEEAQSVRHAFAGAISAILCQKLVPRVGGGRVMAYELLLADDATRNLIRQGKTERIHSKIQTSHNLGMQLLDDHLYSLLNDGIIDKENALAFARKPEDLAKRIVQGDREG